MTTNGKTSGLDYSKKEVALSVQDNGTENVTTDVLESFYKVLNTLPNQQQKIADYILLLYQILDTEPELILDIRSDTISIQGHEHLFRIKGSEDSGERFNILDTIYQKSYPNDEEGGGEEKKGYSNIFFQILTSHVLSSIESLGSCIISINIYCEDLDDPYFAETLIAKIQKKGLMGSNVMIEILEKSPIATPNNSISETKICNIKKLKDFGILIAIDDYIPDGIMGANGVNYSRKNYQSLQKEGLVDILKIDGFYLQKLYEKREEKKQELRDLEIFISGEKLNGIHWFIAEWCQPDEEQIDFFRQLGFTHIQGMNLKNYNLTKK